MDVLNFDRCLEGAIEKFVFKRRINKRKYKLWFNNELRILKREKVFKYQSAINGNTNEAWNNYKTIRNIYKVNIEREKNRYITNKINNAFNQREMWCKIKELVLRKPKNVIKTMIHENIEYKEDTQIAIILSILQIVLRKLDLPFMMCNMKIKYL